jgi:hypothetical protein
LRLSNIVMLVLPCVLAACSSTAVSLDYTATIHQQPRSFAPVSSVSVTDSRDEKDPNYLGAIRGGFGNPLKVMTTRRPVKDEVAAAFLGAIEERGLYDPSARDRLLIDLTMFTANQLLRREAEVSFTLSLVDNSSGRTVYRDEQDVIKINGSVITFDAGVFASVNNLHAIADLALSQAIDQALDKPVVVAVISRDDTLRHNQANSVAEGQ